MGDGSDDVALAPDLARGLSGEIHGQSFGERAKGLLKSLDKMQVELGVPGAKVGLDMAGSGRESAAIQSSLEAAGMFARNYERKGLAVFVDEFQEARLADHRSLLIALQHLDGAPAGCPVAIVAAGLPSILGAVPEAATFGERTDFVEVGLLREVAAVPHGVVSFEELILGAYVPLLIAGVGPLRAALAVAGTAHGVGLSRHQRLDERGHHATKKIRTRLSQLFLQPARHVNTGCCGHRDAPHLSSFEPISVRITRVSYLCSFSRAFAFLARRGLRQVDFMLRHG